MKVLHINNVANVPLHLTDALRQIGIEAAIYQPFLGNPEDKLWTKGQLVLKRVSENLKLAKQVRREKYDIVHIHYAYFGLLGIIGRFHYWLHCHGTDVRRNLYHPLFRIPTTLSLAQAEKVLYSTPDLAEHVKKERADAIFLPNPVDTEMFMPRLMESSEEIIKILLISRLDEIKGVHEVFEAVKNLVKKFPQIKFSAPKWGRFLSTYLDYPVNFYEKVAYSKMPALINSHDIVIGQTKLGILSMSELQAMACGKPVICHYESFGNYEEDPPIFKAHSAKEIEEKVQELIEKRAQWKQIGEVSREWVKKYHDSKKVAKELLQLYQESRH
jgi:glycosyltransferase involved in cell wall biosynthesis